jgi:predicted deacetylase
MSPQFHLVVSIHDVAPPFFDRVRRMMDKLADIGVRRRSLLVIPNYHGQWQIDQHPEFCEWLRRQQTQGDEIILHGYEHMGVGTPKTFSERFKNRWGTVGEGEFLCLSYAEARERIQRGIDLFQRLDIASDGFVAPAWLLNEAGLRAMRDLGFQYTNSYMRFLDLANGASHLAPSLVFGPGALNEDMATNMQRPLSKLLEYSPIVRIVVHPPCIDNSGRFDRILSMTKAQMNSHLPVTYGELLQRLRNVN